MEGPKQQGKRRWRLSQIERSLDELKWNEKHLRRTKLLFCLPVAFLSLVYFALASADELSQLQILLRGINLAVVLLCFVLARFTPWIRAACHIHLLNSVVACASLSPKDLSGFSLGMWSMPLIPLLAAFFFNFRTTVVYTVLTAIPFVLAFLDLAPGVTYSGVVAPDSIWFSTRLQVVLMVSSVGVLLAYISDRGIRRLIRQSGKLREEIHRTRADHRAKATFLARMSHEIRTPVHGILGMIQQLEAMDMGQGLRQSVASMAKSANHLSELLTEILDLSRIEAGRVQPKKQRVELNQLLIELATSFREQALGRGLELTVSCPEQASWANSDPSCLRQALVPIVRNALKFTDRGEVTLGVRRSEQGKHRIDEGAFEIFVRDEGPGLSESEQARIFESFEQVDEETVRQKGGIGLGLTLASRLVHLLGAQLRVHSRPGEGSEFILCLACSHSKDASNPAEPSTRNLTELKLDQALEQQDEQSLRRRRLKVFQRLFPPVSFYYCFHAYEFERYYLLASLLTAMALAFGFGLYAHFNRYTNRQGWAFTLGFIGILTTIGMFDDQIHSDGLWIIALAPVLGTFLLGLGAGLVLVACTCLAVGVIALGEWYFYIPMDLLDSRLDALIIRGFYVSLFCAVALITSSQSKKHEDALRMRREQWEELREDTERANAAKSKFLANMSHEIRTPMHGVLGLAEDLLANELDPAQRDCVQTIHRCGGHLLVLLNEILDSARVESESIELSQLSFDAQELLHDVKRLFASQAANRGLAIELRMDKPEPCLVVGDPTRLMQVLANLVGNAIKYSDKGTIALEFLRESVSGNRVSLGFHVHDQGLGMTESQLESAFQEYVQVDEGGMNARGGTGLGLAIAQRLTQAMGGTLDATSTAGEGSCFRLNICLPLAQRTALVADRSAPPEEEESISGLAILVVDDNPINRKVARMQLERLGCKVQTANNGLESLQRVQERTFDMVIMDVRMPVMDGLEATRKIRELPGELGQIPVLALTADGFQEQRDACLAAGMNDHLAKPFKAQELKALLRRNLKQGSDCKAA